jgi:hypothetical protein
VKHTQVPSRWSLLDDFPNRTKRFLPVLPADTHNALFRHHVLALQEASDLPHDVAVVIQNNCYPATAHWKEKAEELFQSARFLPWGMIYLCGGIAGGDATQVIGTPWAALPNGSARTYAYALPREVVQLFLNEYAPKGKVRVPTSAVLSEALIKAVRQTRFECYTPVLRLLRQHIPSFEAKKNPDNEVSGSDLKSFQVKVIRS